jgi:predicted flap endonuclease-1-like 5' DNA nuclease
VVGAIDSTATVSAADAERIGVEKARIVRSGEGEAAHLRQALADADVIRYQAAAFGEDRRRLFAALADVRGDNARYRQLVIDIENNAPPPILSGAAGPDDLKLIVGVGPVLERMLHNLGIMSFQQIAQWSERDIDEFDARLPEFPGRIRRDQWVTQARSLQQAKYGDGAASLRPDGRRP